MASDSKLISTTEAGRLIADGKAVRSGTEEHAAMMAVLWEQVAKKFVYVASLGKWLYREKGSDKGHLSDYSAQRIIDAECKSKVAVLRYGRTDKRVRMAYESPQLVDVTDVLLEQRMDKHLKPSKSELSMRNAMVVDFMDTYPGRPIVLEVDGVRVFNLWKEPTVKTIEAAKYREPRWFLDVVDRFFGEHMAERDYFLDWCAHLVCKPEIKMPVSVLLTSNLNGAGKNFIAESLKWMVGERNCKSLTADSVKSGFHSFISGTTLAIISELYEQGNYGFADKLKTWQSEDNQFVNIKYGPMENVRNMVHFLAFSNRSTPIYLDDNDRRWFTFASDQKEAASPEWWEDKWRVLRHPKTSLPHFGELGSLRRWFKMRMEDIERTGRFKPYARPPLTEHKRSIIDDSRSVFYQKVRDALSARRLIPSPAHLVSMSDLEALCTSDSAYRPPSNSQKREDLEALGFKHVRTSTGRCWQVPEGYVESPDAF
jgi:hypothetical protein